MIWSEDNCKTDWIVLNCTIQWFSQGWCGAQNKTCLEFVLSRREVSRAGTMSILFTVPERVTGY